MTATCPLVFKIASLPGELEQVRRLNYRTFVEEIPQHAPNPDGVLADPFDDENTYVVALQDERVVGMICVRDRRPFSLDRKLPDLDAHLPPARSVCEIRLLSVEQQHRTGVVFRGLVERLADACAERGHDLAVISGTTRQLKLYRHLGFIPFGPLVGTAEAPYQPMYLTLDAFRRHAEPTVRRTGRPVTEPACFLPGPTTIAAEVRAALAQPPRSHRATPFLAELRDLRQRLAGLAGAADAQVLLGSGTLANDMVGGQLRCLGTPGVVLANGEFGERLADHAARWDLPHRVVRAPWGAVFDRREVEAAAAECGPGGWLWAVHCETSTGVMNDLPMLRDVCEARGLRLALDCVSSLGSVPLGLAGVYLASATSGKGLGSFAGLAVVFHNQPVAPAPGRLPRYLDLGLYAAGDGVAFTHSSNLVRALATAVARRDWPAWLDQVAADGAWLRGALRARGLRILAPEHAAAPAVTTIIPPPGTGAQRLGEELEQAGFLLSFRSDYLQRRGWLQVCLMGDYPRERLPELAHRLAPARPGSGCSA